MDGAKIFWMLILAFTCIVKSIANDVMHIVFMRDVYIENDTPCHSPSTIFTMPAWTISKSAGRIFGSAKIISPLNFCRFNTTCQVYYYQNKLYPGIPRESNTMPDQKKKSKKGGSKDQAGTLISTFPSIKDERERERPVANC